MPWNETDREKYAPCHQRYASDLSDGEFALVQPLLPPSKRRGRKPTDPRHILDALFYMVRTGCQWRYLPKDFPPFTTVQNRFYAWRDSGLWEQIAAVLVMHVREAEGKDASPTVVIVDSQAVKTTEAGGERGYDVAKATKGRKRHVAVDTLGLPIKCQITAANVQDRDALAPLLKAVSRKSPWVKLAFADSGYNGDEAQRAAFAASRIRTTVVKRTDKQLKGFVVLPKRWIAERTFGWINRARRLAKDFETLVTSSLGWFMLAVSFLLIRRIDRDYKPPSDFESGSQRRNTQRCRSRLPRRASGSRRGLRQSKRQCFGTIWAAGFTVAGHVRVQRLDHLLQRPVPACLSNRHAHGFAPLNTRSPGLGGDMSWLHRAARILYAPRELGASFFVNTAIRVYLLTFAVIVRQRGHEKGNNRR